MLANHYTREITEDELRELESFRNNRDWIWDAIQGSVILCVFILAFVSFMVWLITPFIHDDTTRLWIAIGMGFMAMSLAGVGLFRMALAEKHKRRSVYTSENLLVSELEFDEAWEIIESSQSDEFEEGYLLGSKEEWFVVLSRTTGPSNAGPSERKKKSRKSNRDEADREWMLEAGRGPPRRIVAHSVLKDWSGEVLPVEFVEFSDDSLPVNGRIRYDDLPEKAITLNGSGDDANCQFHWQIREFYNSPKWAGLRASLQTVPSGDDTMPTHD